MKYLNKKYNKVMVVAVLTQGLILISLWLGVLITILN
jgi:hypothetical protein